MQRSGHLGRLAERLVELKLNYEAHEVPQRYNHHHHYSQKQAVVLYKSQNSLQRLVRKKRV